MASPDPPGAEPVLGASALQTASLGPSPGLGRRSPLPRQGSRFSSATKPGCGCTGAICSSGTVPCHAVLWEPCQSSRTLLEHPHCNRALSAATDAICSPGEKMRAQMPAAFPGSGDEPCRVGLRVLGLWGQLGGVLGLRWGATRQITPQPGRLVACGLPARTR